MIKHIEEEKHISNRNNDKYQKMILKLEKFYFRRKQRRWRRFDRKKLKEGEPEAEKNEGNIVEKDEEK